jgi:hypothetical protein
MATPFAGSMRNDEHTAVRQVVWHLHIPEAVVDLYFRYVRALPGWKRDFPPYVHPDIRDALLLGHNRAKVSTLNADYVFFFDERDTLVIEAAERVRTGTLDVYRDDVLVLRLGISPADTDQARSPWVPRSVEEFLDGEWVEELLALGPKLEAHESAQRQQEHAAQQSDMDSITALKNKLESSTAVLPKASWLQRLRRRENR